MDRPHLYTGNLAGYISDIGHFLYRSISEFYDIFPISEIYDISPISEIYDIAPISEDYDISLMYQQYFSDIAVWLQYRGVTIVFLI